MNSDINGKVYINRDNGRGRAFTIKEIEPYKCEIETSCKVITVNACLETMSQAWYDWQMEGKLIQDAFDFLNAEEREFLITGITPEEWKRIFSEPTL